MFPLWISSFFLVHKIKEREFKKKICDSLPCFLYTYCYLPTLVTTMQFFTLFSIQVPTLSQSIYCLNTKESMEEVSIRSRFVLFLFSTVNYFRQKFINIFSQPYSHTNHTFFSLYFLVQIIFRNKKIYFFSNQIEASKRCCFLVKKVEQRI